MSVAFNRAVDFVLKYEGGYVNDPNDPGGETNFGISKAAYPALNIATLTREVAIEIYREDYWLKCRCEEMPAELATVLFDSAVNQGPSAAVKCLQKALGITADGVIGSQTINKANTCIVLEVLPELVAQRAVRYAGTGQDNYYLGWFRRLAACHQLTLIQ